MKTQNYVFSNYEKDDKNEKTNRIMYVTYLSAVRSLMRIEKTEQHTGQIV